MTKSLDNELPGNEMQKADLYVKKHRCRSIPKYN